MAFLYVLDLSCYPQTRLSRSLALMTLKIVSLDSLQNSNEFGHLKNENRTNGSKVSITGGLSDKWPDQLTATHPPKRDCLVLSL